LLLKIFYCYWSRNFEIYYYKRIEIHWSMDLCKNTAFTLLIEISSHGSKLLLSKSFIFRILTVFKKIVSKILYSLLRKIFIKNKSNGSFWWFLYNESNRGVRVITFQIDFLSNWVKHRLLYIDMCSLIPTNQFIKFHVQWLTTAEYKWMVGKNTHI